MLLLNSGDVLESEFFGALKLLFRKAWALQSAAMDNHELTKKRNVKDSSLFRSIKIPAQVTKSMQFIATIPQQTDYFSGETLEKEFMQAVLEKRELGSQDE